MFSRFKLMKYLVECIDYLNDDLSKLHNRYLLALDNNENFDFESCTDEIRRCIEEKETCRLILWKIEQGDFDEQEEKE